MKKLLPIILGAIALASTSALVAVLMTAKDSGPPTPEAEVIAAAAAAAAVVPEKINLPDPIYVDLKPDFTVNFAGKKRPRMMSVSLSAVTRDESVVEALERHAPAIRNNLLLTFSGKTSDELITREGKEQLRIEALAVIRSTLKARAGDPGVDELHITKLVMQ